MNFNTFPEFSRHMRMSGSATHATQNHITTCFDTFEKEKFCSFRPRHGEATGKSETGDETCWSKNMQKPAFRARLPPIFTLVASKPLFAYEFSLKPENLQPQNRCFVRGFCQFSSHLAKCNVATFATEFAPCRHLTQPWQCDSQKARNTLKCCACPGKMTMDMSKVLRLPRKLQRIF